jgi:hypothetical protein
MNMQWRLGLEPAIGWPLAGRIMLFDVRRHEWSGEILDRIGLSPERLARPLASGTIAGTIAGAIAGDLGLTRHTDISRKLAKWGGEDSISELQPPAARVKLVCAVSLLRVILKRHENANEQL